MGLGPSTKMTTLHHFNCPVVKEILKQPELALAAVIVAGVSENFSEKTFTAKRVGDLVDSMNIDGAIVTIDGWGNHHVDFVSIIEALGKRGLPSVGLSYFGVQGQLVYTSPYLDTLIDFNKSASGYESCVVGENNLSELDAFKAVALLKNKLKPTAKCPSVSQKKGSSQTLTLQFFTIDSVLLGEKTSLVDRQLTVCRDPGGFSACAQWIQHVSISVIKPEEHHLFVNSILDFAPIACKIRGELGTGVTHVLEGVTVMTTGVEALSHFQPANIGSSEGMLDEQVVCGVAGTPTKGATILHIDIVFQDGEGRSKEGIRAAHYLTDRIVEDIRTAMKGSSLNPTRSETYSLNTKQQTNRIVLIKVVSGLGNMYDTALFPNQPGGYAGAYSTMSFMNMPVVVSSNQVLDGVIHSLL